MAEQAAGADNAERCKRSRDNFAPVHKHLFRTAPIMKGFQRFPASAGMGQTSAIHGRWMEKPCRLTARYLKSGKRPAQPNDPCERASQRMPIRRGQITWEAYPGV